MRAEGSGPARAYSRNSTDMDRMAVGGWGQLFLDPDSYHYDIIFQILKIRGSK